MNLSEAQKTARYIKDVYDKIKTDGAVSSNWMFRHAGENGLPKSVVRIMTGAQLTPAPGRYGNNHYQWGVKAEPSIVMAKEVQLRIDEMESQRQTTTTKLTDEQKRFIENNVSLTATEIADHLKADYSRVYYYKNKVEKKQENWGEDHVWVNEIPEESKESNFHQVKGQDKISIPEASYSVATPSSPADRYITIKINRKWLKWLYRALKNGIIGSVLFGAGYLAGRYWDFLVNLIK